MWGSLGASGELCTSSLVTPLSKSEEISCMHVYVKQQELLKVYVVRFLDKRIEMAQRSMNISLITAPGRFNFATIRRY